MLTSNLSNIVNAEQLMLERMQTMQVKTQPEFVVSSNPFDNATDKLALNQPISFSGAMRQVLDTVNQQQSVASEKMTAVESGKSDDLVGAMIASQKASLSFSALMQVRNKVVSSFDEVLRMPV